MSSCVLAELSSVQERWCGDAEACHRATPWTLHHGIPFLINSLHQALNTPRYQTAMFRSGETCPEAGGVKVHPRERRAAESSLIK